MMQQYIIIKEKAEGNLGLFVWRNEVYKNGIDDDNTITDN